LLARGLEMWREAVDRLLEKHQQQIDRLQKRVDELERAGRGLAVEDPRNWESDHAD